MTDKNYIFVCNKNNVANRTSTYYCTDVKLEYEIGLLSGTPCYNMTFTFDVATKDCDVNNVIEMKQVILYHNTNNIDELYASIKNKINANYKKFNIQMKASLPVFGFNQDYNMVIDTNNGSKFCDYLDINFPQYLI